MSVWEWVWECGMEITAWMKYTTWVSELCFVFVKVTVVVLFFGFIFNCRRKLPFVSLLYMGMFCVRIALSFAPSLSLSGARLHLPKSGWAKRGSSCDCDFRLMQFIIMATAAETFAEAKAATSAATAIELPFGYECRPPQCRCWCRGNLSNSKKTQRKWKKQNKIEEKTKK